MLIAKTMAEWAAAPEHRSDELLNRLLDEWIAAQPEPKPERRQAAEAILREIGSWLEAEAPATLLGQNE
jgi:hypothetical protein